MTDLLDLLAEAEGNPRVTHVALPDFSLGCGVVYLDKPRRDRVVYNLPARWADVTCPWCRSLGRAYYRQLTARMQRR